MDRERKIKCRIRISLRRPSFIHAQMNSLRSHKRNALCKYEIYKLNNMWCSKFQQSSYWMNQHRAVSWSCSSLQCHKSSTGTFIFEEMRGGRLHGKVCGEREAGIQPAAKRAETLTLQGKKRESLSQTGVTGSNPTWQRGFPNSPSLWRTLTALIQEQINDAMSSNPEGSRLLGLHQHSVNPVMNPHSAKLLFLCFGAETVNVFLQRLASDSNNLLCVRMTVVR